MKKIVFTAMIIAALLIGITGTVFAKVPAEYTIDVRNRTGAPVQFNYRGADGINHWATIPAGVTSLTLTQGVYAYWADPKCGHIAGNVNIDAQNKTLWIGCESAHPFVVATFIRKSSSSSSCSPWGWGIFTPSDGFFYSETLWIEGPDIWASWAADRIDNHNGVYGCFSDFPYTDIFIGVP